MMKKGILLHGLLVLSITLLFGIAAEAQMSGGSYSVPFSAVGEGGGEMTGGGYTATGLVGQVGPGTMRGGGYWNGGGIWYYQSKGHINESIEARSGSGSCSTCSPSLPPGYPSYLAPPTDLYQDYVTIQNTSGFALTLPIQADLTEMTPGVTASVPPAIGTGLAGGTYWEFSSSDPHGPGVGGTSFPSGEKISEMWEFDPAETPFTFWVDLYPSGGKGKKWLGREVLCAGPRDRAVVPGGEVGQFTLDDGSEEIHTGSIGGTCVIANRFTALSSVKLEAVEFHTSGAASGDWAEVIVYEDASGAAAVPDASMEVWRTGVVLGEGGFQRLPVGACPVINKEEVPGAAFFVALANRGARSCSLGMDLSGAYAGATYISTDGGSSFKPISSIPIIDGNAMIRVEAGQAPACFVGVAVGR